MGIVNPRVIFYYRPDRFNMPRNNLLARCSKYFYLRNIYIEIFILSLLYSFVEHLTAILAELLLATRCGGKVIGYMEPSHRYIWVWHAIEETEHKVFLLFRCRN